MKGTQGPGFVCTRLQRIAYLAREAPERAFTNLAHHIDVPFLYEAYRRTRKDGAPGVDGMNRKEYETNLHERLVDLHERFKSGLYKAPPVRRAYVEKEDGRKRPLGIPTLEDKILQRAVVMVLNEIYERDFLDCSYGFRPGRGTHQCLEGIWKWVMDHGGAWVLDADIKGYFDNVSPRILREFLDRRVRDGVIRRVIHKWLKAGVLEEGVHYHPETGVPQGGVISPLLSNIYLHEVLDVWFARVVQPRMRGPVAMFRFADDFVLLFALEQDARRVWEVLPKRFAKYELTIHPEKSKLVYFYPPRGNEPERKEPRSLDFVGFTLYWGKSRRGRWVVRRKTRKSRIKRAITRIRDWCMAHRHDRIPDQHSRLSSMLRGHYQYYGVTSNIRSLEMVYLKARRAWKTALDRRSQKRHMSWKRFEHLLELHPLPRPRIMRSVYAS